MKAEISIIEAYYSDETTGKMLWNVKDVRKALRKKHQINDIVTTKEGKRLRTSPIVEIKKNYIETKNSFYVFT